MNGGSSYRYLLYPACYTDVLSDARSRSLESSLGPSNTSSSNDIGHGIVLRSKRRTERQQQKPNSAVRNERLLSLLRNPVARRALHDLSADEAQLFIDYLHSVLLQPASPGSSSQKLILVVLYKLCKSFLLYPHCYILKDINFESQEAGGGFSDIYKGRLGQQQLCLKVIRLFQRSDAKEMLKIYAKEAILWGALHHPNILPFYGIYYRDKERKQICLVSPWLPNGNLIDYLKKYPSKPESHSYTISPSAWCTYMIRASFMVNILIDDNGRACLADFGLSSIRTDQTLARCISATTVQGLSCRWAAPELLADSPRPTSASDMWAFGCVCYEIVSGKQPFSGLSDMQVIHQLMTEKMPANLRDFSVTTDDDKTVKEIVARCWIHNADGRPKCEEAVRKLGASVVHENWNDRPVGRGTQIFRDAMKRNEDIAQSFDLQKINKILDLVEVSSRNREENFSGLEEEQRLEDLRTLRDDNQHEDGNAGESSEESTPSTPSPPAQNINLEYTADIPPRRPQTNHQLASTATAPYPGLKSLLKTSQQHRPPHSSLEVKHVRWSSPYFSYPRVEYPRARTDNAAFGDPGVDFDLHPLLSGGSLIFNLSARNFSAMKYVGPGRTEPVSEIEWNEPATWPGLIDLRIECHFVPQWPIIIELDPDWLMKKRSSNSKLSISPIKVGEILIKVYDHFSQRISRGDWNALALADEAAIARAYAARCKALEAVDEAIERSNGVKRIDYCRGEVWFDRLTVERHVKHVVSLHFKKQSLEATGVLFA
ncbi:hypothetical protein AN958_02678 [Leucoagaricus sp. SymC.cos]|nr:hypothetical protein AN958_02678 [Leucoagaricus sp. SymC.cos]